MHRNNVTIEHLSAKDLMEMHLALRAKTDSIKRSKSTAPQVTQAESGLLNDSWSHTTRNLSLKRVEKLATFSVGEWDEKKQMAYLSKITGNCWVTLGECIDSKIWIRPFEILYLMESNDLELYFNKIPVSIEEFRKIIFDNTNNENIEQKYKTYVSCKRAGLLIREYDPLKIYTTKKENNNDEITKHPENNDSKKRDYSEIYKNSLIDVRRNEIEHAKNRTTHLYKSISAMETDDTIKLTRQYYLSINKCFLHKHIELSEKYTVVPGADLLKECRERSRKRKMAESLIQNKKQLVIKKTQQKGNVEKNNKKRPIGESCVSENPNKKSKPNHNKACTINESSKLNISKKATEISHRFKKSGNCVYVSHKADDYNTYPAASRWKHLKQSAIKRANDFERSEFVKKLGIQTMKMSILMGEEFKQLKEFIGVVKHFNHIYHEDIEIPFGTDDSGNIYEATVYDKIKEPLDEENDLNRVENDLCKTTSPVREIRATNIQDKVMDNISEINLSVKEKIQNMSLIKTINSHNVNENLQVSFELFDMMVNNYKKSEAMCPNINLFVTRGDQFPLDPTDLKIKCKNDGHIMSATYTSSGILYFIIWEDASSVISTKAILGC